MASYLGNIGEDPIACPLPGRIAGLPFPPAGGQQPFFDIGALAIPHVSANDLTYVDEGAAAIGTDEWDGHLGEEMTPGLDWFEHLHILPRHQIDFGNIITAIDEHFEFFSAFRRTTINLTVVTNNVATDVELPDFPTPAEPLPPFCSFLDSASARHIPVAAVVRAFVLGSAAFDSTIDFTFDTGIGIVSLGVRGNRLVLITAEFVKGVRETLQWRTDILETKSGKEQRIADRKNPRQIIEAELRLEDMDRQRFHAMLFSGQGRSFGVPVWSEEMTVTVAVTGGTTPTVTVDATTGADLRIGGLATVYKDARTFDVLTVVAKTATTITFQANIHGSYAVGDKVIPVRVAYVQPVVQGQRPPVGVETFGARFQVIDNDTGAPIGDTGGFSSYDGKVLLDDYNIMSGAKKPSRLEQRIYLLDNATGHIVQTSPWDRHRRGHSKSFVTKTRTALWALRRLLYSLRGQQVAFWIPTFADDMTVTAALVNGQDKITVSNLGYTRFIVNQEPKATFRITFTDDSSLVRTITACEELSETEEQLTLDVNWPGDRPVDEIVRVQFYELVRADTDDIVIEHGNTVGQARVTFPVKVVFD